MSARMRATCARGIAGGALRVELRTRDQLLLHQFGAAAVLLLRLVGRGLGRLQRGLLLVARQGDQHRARAHLVAAVEMHPLDRFADLAVTVTDSRACTVPLANRVSLHGDTPTTGW